MTKVTKVTLVSYSPFEGYINATSFPALRDLRRAWTLCFFIRNSQTVKTLPDTTLNKVGFNGIFLIGFYLVLKLSWFTSYSC